MGAVPRKVKFDVGALSQCFQRGRVRLHVLIRWTVAISAFVQQ
jgi:hypothetical protein